MCIHNSYFKYIYIYTHTLAAARLTYGLMTSQDRGLGNLSVSELAVQAPPVGTRPGGSQKVPDG